SPGRPRWAAHSWSATRGRSQRASASPRGPAWPPSASCLAKCASSCLRWGWSSPASRPTSSRWSSPSRSSRSAPSSPSSSGSFTSAARLERPPTPGTPRGTNPRLASNGKNGKNGSNALEPANAWAGAGRRKDGKIRVAIVGVGNCASSLVQGRYYYENAKDDEFVPGLMHVNLGGYHVRDIEFVAAFDIDKNKVGKDLSEVIYTKPNNTYVFQKVPPIGVTVERGMTHDGLGKYLSQIIEKAPGPTAHGGGLLKEP